MNLQNKTAIITGAAAGIGAASAALFALRAVADRACYTATKAAVVGLLNQWPSITSATTYG